MTNTTSELLTVNGVNLKTLANNVETLAATLRIPAKRGESAQAAGRHGAIAPKRRYYGDNTLAWPMWVAGCDEDGLVPVGQTARKLFYANLDKLTRLFAAPSLDIRHTLPDGSVRQGFGQVIDQIDFSTNQSPLGKFSVAVYMPDPFWQDVNTSTQSFGLTAAAATFALTNFTGATAPISDSVIRFTGATNNPKITDPVTGAWLQYNDVLTAGQYVEVDCSTWAATAGGGLVLDYAKLLNAGGGRYYEISPQDDGVPKVGFSSSGGTGGTLAITGRRKFLVG